MNPIEKLESNIDEFSKAELSAAKYILESPASVIQLTLTELAKASHSSTAAVIRMCQRIGYDGYKEFKFSVSRYLFTGPADPNAAVTKAQDDSLDYVANAYIRYIAIMRDTLPRAQIRRLAQMIINAGSITVFGINRTGFSAMQLSFRLFKLGIASHPVTDPIIMKDYTPILGTDDLCIFFTIRGVGTPLYPEFAKQMREQGCRVAVFTMDPKLPLNKLADEAIVLPRISKTPDLSFLDDQALYFVFIEVLLREISQLMS